MPRAPQFIFVLLFAVITSVSMPGHAPAGEPCRAEHEPQLLVRLPEICPTPDGMALDASGNLFLACPNYADQTHPAVLMKIDPENRVRLWCRAPVHPETGVGCPMGIAFGPEGHLYISTTKAGASRTIRGASSS